MIDYLDSIARRAVDLVTDVRPVFSAPFAGSPYGHDNPPTDPQAWAGDDARSGTAIVEGPQFPEQSQVHTVTAPAPPGPPATTALDVQPPAGSTSASPIAGPTIPIRRDPAPILKPLRSGLEENSTGVRDKTFETAAYEVSSKNEAENTRLEAEETKSDEPVQFVRPNWPERTPDQPAAERHPEPLSTIQAAYRGSNLKSANPLPVKKTFEPTTVRKHSITEIVPQSAIASAVPLPAISRSIVNSNPPPASETIVQVTIGRVEVRAHVGEPKRPPAQHEGRREPLPGLAEYLRGAATGRHP
jgi:hypothetical protein